jgi:DNA-binding GntR family transcriptional regulator
MSSMPAAFNPLRPNGEPANSSPVRRNLLRHQVHLELINRIVRGDLVPGDRLNEAELAAELQISRTPLKEAILAMEREGFVQAGQTRGHVVTPMSAREIEEVYPILMSLEALVLARYPPSTETLDRMEAINTKFARAEGASASIELDDAFHGALFSDCPNGHLIEFKESLELVILRYHVRYVEKTRNPDQSAREHEMIINATRRRDTAAAVAALDRHWDNALGRLVSAIRADLPNGEDPPESALRRRVSRQY